jgi:hypothetical protein
MREHSLYTYKKKVTTAVYYTIYSNAYGLASCKKQIGKIVRRRGRGSLIYGCWPHGTRQISIGPSPTHYYILQFYQ